MLALTLAIAAGARAEEPAWRSIGPDGGDIWDLQYHAADPSIVLAATGGGVYRSSDGGASWSPLGLPDSEVLSLAVHAARPDVILAGTRREESVWSGRLYRSENAGSTWSAITPEGFLGAIYDIALDSRDPDTVYVGAEGGLFCSRDGGGTWYRGPGQLGEVSAVRRVVADPALSGKAYALFGNSVHRTTDAFQTSTVIVQLDWNAAFLAIDPRDPTVLYLTSWYALLKSIDGGSTWRNLTDGGASDAPCAGGSVGRLALAPSKPDTIYVVCGGKLLASRDAGDHWMAAGDLPPTHDECGATATSLAVSPLAARHLFVGMWKAGLHRSRDGGATWFAAHTGMVNTYVTALLAGADGSLLAGTDQQGIFYSTDSAATWSARNAGLPCFDWMFETPDFVVSQLTRDWEHSETLYAATSRGLHVSEDSGSRWRLLGFQNTTSVLSLPAYPGAIFVAVDSGIMQGGGIFRSDDRGATWIDSTVALQPIYAYELAADPWDGRSILALATTWADQHWLGLLATGDGGRTWQRRGTLPGSRLTTLVADPQTPGLLYAAGDAGIFISGDHGYTWVASTRGLPSLPSHPCRAWVGGLVLDPLRSATLFAATMRGVYVSLDRGRSWHDFSAGLATHFVFRLAVDEANRQLFAGTYGGGVYVRDLPPPPTPRRHLQRTAAYIPADE